MDDPGAGLIILLILLVVEFLSCGFCAAMYEIKPEETESELRKKKNKRIEKKVRRILKNQHSYMYSTMAVISVSYILIGYISLRAFSRWVHSYLNVYSVSPVMSIVMAILSVLISLLFITFISLIVCYQIPANIARRNPLKWLAGLAGLMTVINVILHPFVSACTFVSKQVLRLMGVTAQSLSDDVTEEEIRSMVEEGHEHGVIDQKTAEMITNVFEFSEKEAQDIMTHRNDMVAIEDTESVTDTISFMLSKHFSRFPVYHENVDQIIGILHLRDIVKYRERHKEHEYDSLSSIRGIIRKPVFVPETKNIDVLFRQMQRDKTQMVIVIDEYGQTAGLIAMEDILEEIVGNILDEYDVVENHIFPTANKDEFIVDGKTPLEEVENRFGLDFGDLPFETVNGFMISKMEHIPGPNEHFTTIFEGYRFRILTVEDHCIKRLLMTKIRDSGAAGAE